MIKLQNITFKPSENRISAVTGKCGPPIARTYIYIAYSLLQVSILTAASKLINDCISVKATMEFI